MQLIPGFNQVLTRSGWVDLEDYYNMLKKSPYEILVVYKGHCYYGCPISFACSKYKGTLVEVTTDTSRVILKPSTKLISQDKASILHKGDRLERFFSYQTVDKVNMVSWEGNQLSITFERPVYLPIKFENDYILIPT